MDEELIGFLKFNHYVNKLVDNQIWMPRVESFNKRHPRNKNDDQISDPLEGKVEVADGSINYTELMNLTGTKQKSACYIASFTGLHKEDFSNGRIRKEVADELEQVSGNRDFALMEANIKGKNSTNSIDEAFNDPDIMSPRLVDSNVPLGYLDSNGENRHYMQQIIMADRVQQNALSTLSKYRVPESLKKEDPKYIASNIITATSRDQAVKLILDLGRETIASIIQKLPMEVSQKFIRNMDWKYVENLQSLLSSPKYIALKKAWRCQLANQLEPNNLEKFIKFKAVKYTKETIHEKKEEVLEKAKKCEKYRNDLLEECLFEKPKEYACQKEYRIVLVVETTKENQELPCVMDLQFYKEPLSHDNKGIMQFHEPIQAKKVCNDFIYNLEQSDLINLGKSIIEDSDNRVYPIVTKVRREYY